MVWRLLTISLIVLSSKYVASYSAFDQQLYEDVLDPELCQQQLILLSNHTLRYQFFDASFSIPNGILTGHVSDLGNYHQCLGIDDIIGDMPIQGKYCSVIVPPHQDNPIQWPEWNITIPDLNITLPEWNGTLPGLNLTLPSTKMYGEVSKNMALRNLHLWAFKLAGFGKQTEQVERIFPAVITTALGMTLGVCIPRVCSARQALDFVQQEIGILNITFQEYYCRLPDDKPFTTADYVAIAIFGSIGILIGMSTIYDLIQVFHYERESSEISRLYSSFSLYTNTRRLLTFKSSPGTLECVDGIRTISMLWVVVGHTYSFTLTAYIHNLSYMFEWMTSFSSIWIHAAPITVDTFFMLSGVLAVYTVVGKIGRGRFARSVHLFYLNRILRMFPLLAAVVLFNASLINHVADGPFWMNIAWTVDNCRRWWWTALLHVQNYVNPIDLCIQQSWYLSVDMQLYYIAPIVLFFLWGGKLGAWCALCAALLISLVSSTTISFFYNFSAALANINRIGEFNDYLKMYYLNTLARAPPFFVGMIYGYMLHIYKDRKIRISRVNALILWLLSLLMMAFCIFSIYPVMQADHTAQMFDNFLNSYMRAIWAVGLGWVIFACTKGYGGPINWFLSLKMWKLPARLSYAVYLIHINVIIISNGSWVKTHYFTPAETFYRFASDITLSFLAAFALCVCIDSPCSTLQKLLLGGAKKNPPKPRVEAQNNNLTFTDGKVLKTSL